MEEPAYELPYKKGNRRVLKKKSLPHNLGNPKKGPIMMSNRSRQEYLSEIQERYWLAGRKEKGTILDEFSSTCRYNRKYAIRVLNILPKQRKARQKKLRGRPKQYHHEHVIQFLRDLWQASNLACSKRLKAMIPLWLPYYEQTYNVELSLNVKTSLMNISHSTIDRLLAPLRPRYQKIGLSTTKPGSLLKKHIPIRVNQWDETKPGFLEADTVAHCGTSMAGMFVYTVNTVDIATGWTEQRAAWGKGEYGVLQAIASIEQSLPFRLRGFDSDNGSEFLNWRLLKYLTNRKRPVQFTRSREYHKDDNAHVEGKNWTHVRQYLGYRRFDHHDYATLFNELYTSEWRLFFNFFLPSMKLLDKQRIGSRTIKKHDTPKTPFQRVLESAQVTPAMKLQLRQQHRSLNPFLLHQTIKRKITAIFRHLPQTTPLDQKIIITRNNDRYQSMLSKTFTHNSSTERKNNVIFSKKKALA